MTRWGILIAWLLYRSSGDVQPSVLRSDSRHHSLPVVLVALSLWLLLDSLSSNIHFQRESAWSVLVYFPFLLCSLP